LLYEKAKKCLNIPNDLDFLKEQLTQMSCDAELGRQAVFPPRVSYLYGLEVSVFAFHSDDSSSKKADILLIFIVSVVKKRKNRIFL